MSANTAPGLGLSLAQRFGSNQLFSVERFWRLRILLNNGDAYTALQEVQLRTIIDGPDVTTPATPVTSTSTLSGTYPPGKLVDNDIITTEGCWVSASGVPPPAIDIVFDLGVGTPVLQFGMMAQNDAGVGPPRAPLDFSWASSEDNIIYNTKLIVEGATGWAPGVLRFFA